MDLGFLLAILGGKYVFFGRQPAIWSLWQTNGYNSSTVRNWNLQPPLDLPAAPGWEYCWEYIRRGRGDPCCSSFCAALFVFWLIALAFSPFAYSTSPVSIGFIVQQLERKRRIALEDFLTCDNAEPNQALGEMIRYHLCESFESWSWSVILRVGATFSSTFFSQFVHFRTFWRICVSRIQNNRSECSKIFPESR